MGDMADLEQHLMELDMTEEEWRRYGGGRTPVSGVNGWRIARNPDGEIVAAHKTLPESGHRYRTLSPKRAAALLATDGVEPVSVNIEVNNGWATFVIDLPEGDWTSVFANADDLCVRVFPEAIIDAYRELTDMMRLAIAESDDTEHGEMPRED